MSAENVRNWEFKASEVSEIRAETEAGGITLIAEEGPLLKAELSGEYSPEKCVVTAEVKNGRLLLKAASRKKWFRKSGSCGAGFKVYAPSGVKLVSKTGAGNIEIGPFSSGAEIYVGAGNIKLAGLSGAIKMSIGAGDVKGEVYSEALECKSGAGALDLAWSRAPKAGKASIKAGMGAVALSFPSASKLYINNSTGLGGFSSEIVSTPAAPFRLDINNGLGAVSIKKR